MKPFEEIVSPYQERLGNTKYKIRRCQKCEMSVHPDLQLFMKWAYRVEKGWYGFALGNNVPYVWTQIIDSFLTELEKVAPKFQIHQIKLKFGGLRFYVKLNVKGQKKIKSIHEEISKLEALLHSDKLIY